MKSENPKGACVHANNEVRCCWATLHRLGHSGKLGNHKTWDSGPIPMGEAIGGKKYLQCRAEHRAAQVLKS